MKTIQLYGRLPDSDMAALEGQLIDESYYDTLVDGQEDTCVMLPNMEPLFMVRRQVIGPGTVQAMLPSFRKAAKAGDLANRGGAVSLGSNSQRVEQPDGTSKKRNRVDLTQYRHLFDDKGNMISRGNVVGFFDRDTPRFPACRLSSFAAHNTGHWTWMQEYSRVANGVFADTHPGRYAVQLDYAQRTHKDFVIPGTCFTTMTVNRNWQTAVHQDKGDLAAGCGVMGCIGNDKYSGLYFTYPRYRVALHLRSGDIVVNNVHEWHGNTPVREAAPGWERITIVLYYRQHMLDCQSMTEEQRKEEDYYNANPIFRRTRRTSQ